jgi:hypothetical protein
MTPHDRTELGITSARYLEALERGDDTALEALWAKAANDTVLVAVFREIHAGLLDEDAAAAITDAAERHMKSSEIISPATGPVTVGEVARELFQHTPGGLPADAHQMNERLRLYQDELPTNLGLSALVAWAEAKFGPAPRDYWKAFREAAIKLDLRRGAGIEYQLAARSASKPGEKK